MIESTRDINLLHPLVKQNVQLFLEYCTKKGYKVGISETLRTVERQDYLYSLGREDKSQPIRTNAKGSDKSSYHQWGLAIDFYQNIKGKEYDPVFVEEVGKIGEQFGFEWGGRWAKLHDDCHLQMTFGLSIQQLKAGAKVEDSFPSTYMAAMSKLVRKGIIEQPGIWYQNEIGIQAVRSLVIKCATNL